VQGRVIYALCLREMQTRFGRNQLGFLWLFLEPLVLASAIGFMHSLRAGGHDRYGVDIFVFYLIGYTPYFAFRAIISRAVSAFASNNSLLYHQRVKLFDIVMARNILEAMAVLTVVTMVVIGVAWVTARLPYSVPALLSGSMLMLLYAQGLGLLAAAASTTSDVADRIIHPLIYLSLPISGAFFTMHSLPPSIRELLLWNPQVHFHEMVREGMFGDVLISYYDVPYMLGAILIVNLLGLSAMRVIRPEF
jgi:capsular polysaccharide transport system permease protein